RFLELLEQLRDDHDVLEIDGRRWFEYRSVYFDTPDLCCFWDHVHGRLPRFKARTRLYRDTGSCVFEVKLKRSDEELDKRQTEHRDGRANRALEQLGVKEISLSKYRVGISLVGNASTDDAQPGSELFP